MGQGDKRGTAPRVQFLLPLSSVQPQIPSHLPVSIPRDNAFTLRAGITTPGHYLNTKILRAGHCQSGDIGAAHALHEGFRHSECSYTTGAGNCS